MSEMLNVHKTMQLKTQKNNLINEIKALKNTKENLQIEYLIKEKEKSETIKLYEYKRQKISVMQELSINKIYTRASNELLSYMSGIDYYSLLTFYDEAMNAIQTEITRVNQLLLDKRNEYSNL